MARPISFPVKKLVHLTEEQAAKVNDFRYESRIPSDNEAIRQLIEAGLEHTKKPAKRSR
jgi:hypothetical protein